MSSAVNIELDQYIDNLFERLKYLKTLTFKDDLEEVIEILLYQGSKKGNNKIKPEIKISLCEWFFRKIVMYYNPKQELREEVCDQLKIAIRKCKNVFIKGLYLRWYNMDALFNVCEEFFINRFTEENKVKEEQDKYFLLQMLNDVQLIQCKNPMDMKEHFINWINKIDNFEQRSNLLDTLLRYFNNDPKVKSIYEDMKFNEEKKPIDFSMCKEEKKPANKSIYNNNQNAHDEELSESVLKCVYKLLLKTKKIVGELEGDTLDAYINSFLFSNYENNQIIETIRLRLKLDQTVFGKETVFRLTNLFYAVIRYIVESEHREVLTERLYEELVEMRDLCATGYVNRIMNIFIGFDERYSYKLPFHTQLESILSAKISKAMDNASDLVVSGSYSSNGKMEYLTFIRDLVNTSLPTIIKDYGKEDVDSNIIKVLGKVSGDKNRFIYNGFKLILV